MRRLALAVTLATVAVLLPPAATAAAGPGPAGLQQNDSTQDDEARPHQTFDVQCTELRCSFDARDVELDNATVSGYRWDFDDGDVTTGAFVNHTYSNPGTYNVTLTFETEDGETHNRTRAVEVVTNRPNEGEVPWMGLAVGVGALLGSLVLARAT